MNKGAVSQAVGAHHRICRSDELSDGGTGVRFEWVSDTGERQSAFVIRHAGVVTAYLNQCAHVPVELDWQPGVFLDDEGKFLVCATHGAVYRPSDGRCMGGPCRGRGLKSVPCYEFKGSVYAGLEPAARHLNQHE
ncbi:MAG: Rieske 2Fe-2S domain-containing protein [Betaproteobacteria bacterium]|nr:Rieske 2Fe-2S domain-containing protein [Betaproteobacteria bacterium]